MNGFESEGLLDKLTFDYSESNMSNSKIQMSGESDAVFLSSLNLEKNRFPFC